MDLRQAEDKLLLQYLLSHKIVSKAQILACRQCQQELQIQRRQDYVRIAEILVSQGFVTAEQLAKIRRKIQARHPLQRTLYMSKQRRSSPGPTLSLRRRKREPSGEQRAHPSTSSRQSRNGPDSHGTAPEHITKKPTSKSSKPTSSTPKVPASGKSTRQSRNGPDSHSTTPEHITKKPTSKSSKPTSSTPKPPAGSTVPKNASKKPATRSAARAVAGNSTNKATAGSGNKATAGSGNKATAGSTTKKATTGSGAAAATATTAGSPHEPVVDQQLAGLNVQIGMRFGPFQILAEIGRGGMGIVYKALQLPQQRVVALKILRQDSFITKEDVQRFRRESEIAGKLSHPNIVAVHQAGVINQIYYFSMDFIEGQMLSKILATKGPLKWQPTLRWLVDIARAMHYAHGQGLVHRDLKPGNIIIDNRGAPMVMDFGLVKIIRTDERLTQTGYALGTPAYMSPEQARGEKDITPRSDVYALGILLFEMLIGRPPFQGPTMIALLRNIIDENKIPPLIHTIRRSIPPAVSLVCAKALQKRPEDRYPSAAAMADDMATVLSGKSLELSVPSRPGSKSWMFKSMLLACVALVTLVILWGMHLLRPDPDTLVQQIKSELQQKNFAQACRLATDALQSFPDQNIFYHLRAQACLALHDWKQAWQDYTTVLRQGLQITALQGRIQAGKHLQRWSQVEEDLSLILANTNSQTLRQQTLRSRAALREQRRDYQGAMRDYERLLELVPNDIKLYLAHARLAQQQGLTIKAYEDYQKVLQLSPLCLQVYIERGWLYLKKKQWSKAQKDFSKALSLDSSQPKVHLGLAHVYFHQNDYKQALQMLNRAKQGGCMDRELETELGRLLFGVPPPQTGPQYLARGRYLFSQGRVKEGMQAFAAALQTPEGSQRAFRKKLSRLLSTVIPANVKAQRYMGVLTQLFERPAFRVPIYPPRNPIIQEVIEGPVGYWKWGALSCREYTIAAWISEDRQRKCSGTSSIKVQTNAPYDFWLTYPMTRNAHWDLSRKRCLYISFYALNPNRLGFQGQVPFFIFKDHQQKSVRITPRYSGLLNQAKRRWITLRVTLQTSRFWIVTHDTGFNWRRVSCIEIHLDTWDCNPYTIWIDRLLIR